MTLSTWMRQGHRWLGMTFTAISAGIFLALGLGQEPAPWVYFLPLAPLALMVVSGLYLFVQPYLAARRARAQVGAQGAR